MPAVFVKRGSTRAIAAEAAGLRELGRAARAGGAPTVRLLSAGTTSLETAQLDPAPSNAAAAEDFGRKLARTHAFCPEGVRVFGQAPAGLADVERDAIDAAGTGDATSGNATSGNATSGNATSGDDTQQTADRATTISAETSITAAMGDAPLRLVAPGSPGRPWGEFYATDRILPYLKTSRNNGAIHQSGAHIIETLCERLRDGDFDSPQPSLVETDAALLHGDLWAGNIFWCHPGADVHERVLMSERTDDHSPTDATVLAVLIDPACQGGHAESDLAQLTVFSTPFAERIYRAYHEVSPLADGWQQRIGLHQLHILIVHAALFGGSYGSQTISTARGYI